MTRSITGMWRGLKSAAFGVFSHRSTGLIPEVIIPYFADFGKERSPAASVRLRWKPTSIDHAPQF
jgi:hypothetical protein